MAEWHQAQAFIVRASPAGVTEGSRWRKPPDGLPQTGRVPAGTPEAAGELDAAADPFGAGKFARSGSGGSRHRLPSDGPPARPSQRSTRLFERNSGASLTA